MSVITLTLLLPGKELPVQSWTFESDATIRIGRSTDNDVVLYSAVVSRHHVEIRLGDGGWEVVNIGANGTYVEGHPINSMPIQDGLIVRLASSGPKIQIHLQKALSPAQQELVQRQRGKQSGGGSSPKEDNSRETMIN